MSFWTSNETFTCIDCRFSAKRTTTCPYCHKVMRNMGKAFKPPRKTNHSQWKKIELMLEHDLVFGYCRCHRGVRKTKSLSDAKNRLKSRRVHRRNYSEISNVRDAYMSRLRNWKAEL